MTALWNKLPWTTGTQELHATNREIYKIAEFKPQNISTLLMKKEILERLENSVLLLLTFLIDGIIVVCFGLLSKGVKFALENIYGEELSEIDNEALKFVYGISKYILISFFGVFILTHLVLEIKKSLKAIFNDWKQYKEDI